jgi:hypothetical protein
MAITALPGWKVDPNNPNAVVEDKSTYLPGIGGGGNPNLNVSNQGKPGYDVFGNKVSDLVADNGTSRDDEAKLAASLRDSAMRTAPDLSYIDNYIAGLTARQESAVKNINENFDATKASLGEQQRKETGSTSAGLARAGGYLGFSGSGQGALINLAETHRSEMQGLEAKRNAALNEARSAYEEKQFAAAQERYKQAKEYEKESFTRQKDYFDKVKAATDKAKAAEEEQALNVDIYNALAEGATDEMAVFQKLGGTASPEKIRTFFDKIKPKTAASAVYKFSNDEVGRLIGAGLTPQELQLFSDDLNKYGYAKAIEGLSGRQRTIVDEILNGKPTTGVTNGLTLSEALRLGLPPSLIGKPEKEFLTELSSTKPPDWFVGYINDKYGGDISQYPKKDFDIAGNEAANDLKVPKTITELWSAFRDNVFKQFTGGDVGGGGKAKTGGGLNYDEL